MGDSQFPDEASNDCAKKNVTNWTTLDVSDWLINLLGGDLAGATKGRRIDGPLLLNMDGGDWRAVLGPDAGPSAATTIEAALQKILDAEDGPHDRPLLGAAAASRPSEKYRRRPGPDPPPAVDRPPREPLDKTVVSRGTGESRPTDGDLCSLRFAVSLGCGREIWSDRDCSVVAADGTRPPFELVVGGGSVFPGFDAAVRSMAGGERSRFVVQSTLAYGDDGLAPRISPGASLHVDIELIGWTPREFPARQLVFPEEVC